MDHRAAKAVQAEDREARLFQEIKRIPLRFEGARIAVRFRAHLTAHRGRLLSGSEMGQAVYAGSFLRKREIVLDSALVGDAGERARILVHELFHFVWLRLGNAKRESWRAVVERELEARARGELGWSSEWRKRALLSLAGDREIAGEASRHWREYLCESFCDTSAWVFAGCDGHDEFTLARCWRLKRRQWFEATFAAGEMVRI
jgi:hypothetical protein